METAPRIKIQVVGHLGTQRIAFNITSGLKKIDFAVYIYAFISVLKDKSHRVIFLAKIHGIALQDALHKFGQFGGQRQL